MGMKRGTVGRVVCLVLAALVCGTLTGCGRRGGGRRYFGYLDEPVQLALSGKIDGMPFTALLSGGGREERSGDAVGRPSDFTLTYLSPAALAGVKVCFEAEKPSEIALTLDGLTATGEKYEALARAGLLLMSESAVQNSHREDWRPDVGASACEAIVLRTADGALRVHDATTGAPLYASSTRDGHALEVWCHRP